MHVELNDGRVVCRHIDAIRSRSTSLKQHTAILERFPHQRFLELLLLPPMTRSNQNSLTLLHLDVQPVSELNLITTGITKERGQMRAKTVVDSEI